jgi:hypothetical protein
MDSGDESVRSDQPDNLTVMTAVSPALLFMTPR